VVAIGVCSRWQAERNRQAREGGAHAAPGTVRAPGSRARSASRFCPAAACLRYAKAELVRTKKRQRRNFTLRAMRDSRTRSRVHARHGASGIEYRMSRGAAPARRFPLPSAVRAAAEEAQDSEPLSADSKA